MKSYDHKKIEKKWQKEWDAKKLYKAKDGGKKKMYVLDMFPYPSGDGLHVGHPKGYIATDIVSRHARMQGKSVLHPMGWDAFGLPAENYAIKNKVHPRKAVEKNVKRFKEQLKLIGLDYDWSREINTTDPEFYKWTQWIFLKLYEKGLAYQSFEPINWCPSCQTGLANEDLEGNACERCGTIVEKRPMRQWVLKITEYAERLLQDLELLPEWQASIKESQRNWIGKSEGAEIDFPLHIHNGKKYKFVILHGFQSRPDRPRWLYAKAELEKLGHEVILPELPNTNHPKEEEQVAVALAATDYDENTVLCGHSLGAVVALKVLEKLDRPIARLVTVGGFASRNFKDKPRNFDTTFNWSFNAEKIRSNVKSITVLHDPHDHAISDAQAQELSRLLQTPVTIGQATKSHFTGDKEPDVVMWLRPTIRVFTTRPDTLFGATFVTLSPEHPWVQLAIRGDHHGVLTNRSEVKKYVADAAAKTEIERQENKEKTGIKLEGVEAINPATGEKIPVFVADYVLASYGTGAIMAVPAHDERDYDFAKKFDIPIRRVVEPIYRFSPDSPIKEGVEIVKRDVACVVLRNPKNDTYLCVEWKGVNMHGLVTGGIEDGEDIVTAARREIEEETGYKNLKLVRNPGFALHSLFYHRKKHINRWGRFQYVFFDLENEERGEISPDDAALHEIVWKTRKELQNYFTVIEGEYILNFIDDPEHGFVFTKDGILTQSGEFDGLDSADARYSITEKFGTKKTTYKIRDWVFSRQRYWGEPIPIIHCEKCGTVPVPEKDLPVKLPEVKQYEPTGTGESPLAAIEKWVNVKCPLCKGKAKRETNTMPQWAGSSWYWLRYMDPKNKKALVDKKKEKQWAPVDLYVGGAEHATRHLIYGRFWHKFLKDIKVVSTPEPFTRLISVGLIQAEDGRKMSKRYGNVINPDDIVNTYGADTLRVYEMFMGPFSDAIAWKTASLIGARRFVERVWRLQEKIQPKAHEAVERELHKTIKKVGEDIANFKFNTAISQMMILVNAAEAQGITKKQYQLFIALLAPFAPHVSEEIWRELGNKKSVHLGPWPKFDAKKLVADEVTIVIQINGKVRAQMTVLADSEEQVVTGRAEEAALKWLEGKVIRKTIFVANRLVNFVID